MNRDSYEFIKFSDKIYIWETQIWTYTVLLPGVVPDPGVKLKYTNVIEKRTFQK